MCMEVISMPRKPAVLTTDEQTRRALEKLANSRTEEARIVLRSQLVLGCLQGLSLQKIAKEYRVESGTVIKWRNRFQQLGLSGLRDQARSGKPRTYDQLFEESVLRLLEERPPNGMSTWDGPTVAKHLKTSVDAVWRVLRKLGICLARQRTWCISADPEFASKAADIVGLYLNPPERALVIAVDEKPTIQAVERATGFVITRNHKVLRGLQSTYKRHGTVNLFAALEVASGQIRGKVTREKKRVDFLAFMEEVISQYSPEQELHVILDNHSIHKKVDQWLAHHENVKFHYTPTSASWLNMVEIWFGIFSRKVLRGGSFEGQENLTEKIMAYIAAYAEDAHPFIWRKREVVGAQLKNKLSNLCN